MSMRPWQRGLSGILAGMLLFVASTGPARANHQGDYNALRLAFFRHFMEFVLWPKMPDELVFCSVGDNSMENSLHGLQAYRIKKSTLVVRSNVRTETLGDCHVLLIPEQEKWQLAAILKLVRHLPVLIIADFPGGAQLGAMLSLHETAGRLGFDANHTAAEKAGLRLSSRLLQLAHRVY